MGRFSPSVRRQGISPFAAAVSGAFEGFDEQRGRDYRAAEEKRLDAEELRRGERHGMDKETHGRQGELHGQQVQLNTQTITRGGVDLDNAGVRAGTMPTGPVVAPPAVNAPLAGQNGRFPFEAAEVPTAAPESVVSALQAGSAPNVAAAPAVAQGNFRALPGVSGFYLDADQTPEARALRKQEDDRRRAASIEAAFHQSLRPDIRGVLGERTVEGVGYQALFPHALDFRGVQVREAGLNSRQQTDLNFQRDRESRIPLSWDQAYDNAIKALQGNNPDGMLPDPEVTRVVANAMMRGEPIDQFIQRDSVMVRPPQAAVPRFWGSDIPAQPGIYEPTWSLRGDRPQVAGPGRLPSDTAAAPAAALRGGVAPAPAPRAITPPAEAPAAEASAPAPAARAPRTELPPQAFPQMFNQPVTSRPRAEAPRNQPRPPVLSGQTTSGYDVMPGRAGLSPLSQQSIELAQTNAAFRAMLEREGYVIKPREGRNRTSLTRQ